MFRNKLYAGIVEVKNYGVSAKGKHKAMVSEHTFNLVQDILNKRASGQYKVHAHYNPAFKLVKTLRCDNCSSIMSGSKSKARNGYYRCYNKSCDNKQSVKQEDVENAFYDYLEYLQPDQQYVDLYGDMVVRKHHTLKNERESQVEAYTRLYNEFKLKLNRAEDAFEEGVYSLEKFKAKKKEYEPYIIEYKEKMSSLQTDAYEYQTCLNEALLFLQHLQKYWKLLSSRDKAKLHNAIFPQGIYFVDNKIATPEIARVYSMNEDNYPVLVPIGGHRDTFLQLCNFLKKLYYNIIVDLEFFS